MSDLCVITVRMAPALREALQRAAAAEGLSMNQFCRDVLFAAASPAMVCRACGCTELDCSGCVERTGEACWWVAADLCSACAEQERTTESGESTEETNHAEHDDERSGR